MKRLWIILVPLLAVPLVVLSVLSWWMAGRVQDELLVARRKQHAAMLARFDRQFSDQFDALAQQIVHWAQNSLVGDSHPLPTADALWHIICDKAGQWHYPKAFHIDIPPSSAPLIMEDASGIPEELGQALSYERTLGSMSLAIEKYETILQKEMIPSPVKAQALLGLARCMQKQGSPDKALLYYQEIMTDCADVPDEIGTNFGAQASAAHMKLMASHEPAQAQEAWRGHVDRLLADRYRMSPVLAISHLTEALAAAPSAKLEEQDQHRWTDLQSRIDELSEMNEAVAGVISRPDRQSPRLEHRGSKVLMIDALPNVGNSGWVIAAFSADWVWDDWLGRIVRDLAAQDSGLIGIRDAQGGVVVGATIEVDAVSTQMSLSRWGLPWTVEVGFADLPAIQRQAGRRHQLLTGTVAVLIVLIAAGTVLIGHLVRREIELSKMKSDFVDNVSHELRTPVTSIKMFSELLKSGQIAEPARQQEYFHLLASESGRLARMIDNILNFSRIMAGRIQVNRKPTDMTQFLTQQKNILELQARTSGHRINLHLGRDLPVCSIDPDAIARVLSNLVSNATKYSPKEQAISLTAQRRNSILSLMVRDRGTGIPEAELPHVFDRFYRASSPSGQHVQGTGLGLTIVKDTIERHGGTVRIVSRVGEGTVVELLIPIARET